MGSDQFLPLSFPKRPFYLLPVKKNEPLGLVTPPLQAPVSVPFEWEEAPGKPRVWIRGEEKARSARCLQLPPKMSTRVKISDFCSPTIVLDGPYAVGRSVSFEKSDGGRERARLFGSSRWRRSLKENIQVEASGGVDGGEEGDVEESSGLAGAEKEKESAREKEKENETTVKITRMTRKGSFLAISLTRSHLWVSTFHRSLSNH